MSFETLNVLQYPDVYNYALLAATAITADTDVPVNEGKWYSPATDTEIVEGTPPSGNDAANQGAAFTQLTTLVNDLEGLTGPNLTTFTGGGTQTIIPGLYKSASTIVFTAGAVITLDAQGNEGAQFIFIADTAITFTDIGSIQLINSAQPYNVFWLAGSAITSSKTSALTIPGSLIAGTQITFAGPITINNAFAQTADITFIGASEVSNVAFGVICYAKGTKILTRRGNVPIELIHCDDKLATRGIFDENTAKLTIDTKFKPVIWKSHFTINNLNVFSRPVCIKKDALGKDRPFEDLYVSPTHGILFNGKRVHAFNLINGTTIVQEYPYDEVTYYHVELEEHSIITANGVLSESYLDDCNRDLFEDVSVHAEVPLYNPFKHSHLLR